MKKRWMIAALLIVMVCSLAACRKQPAQLPQEETTLPAEAETQQTETEQTQDEKDDPGFSGGILEGDPAGEDVQQEPTSETAPTPTETEPEATTSGGGIPYYSGEEDLLEPPANSSAGEL